MEGRRETDPGLKFRFERCWEERIAFILGLNCDYGICFLPCDGCLSGNVSAMG